MKITHKLNYILTYYKVVNISVYFILILYSILKLFGASPFLALSSNKTAYRHDNEMLTITMWLSFG